MPESSASPTAIVVGSTGGIGGAMAAGLRARGLEVVGLSRSSDPPVDLTDEASLAAAADRLRDRAPVSEIHVCTGLLHDGDVRPERSLRDLDAASLARLFAINAIGPALVAKHLTPLLPRHGRAVFTVLSARVGSIGDNRLGGWYGYRASKAALNMIVKTLAIELARTRPDSICVGLHPGTVDTALSAPFQKNVDPARLFTADQSAAHIIDVIDRLTPTQSGRCFAWDGSEIAP